MNTSRFKQAGSLILAIALILSAFSLSAQQSSGKGDKINGHEYVDLGLSVKWATCNVGASEPGDYGKYFAWGEIEEKFSYTWGDYKLRDLCCITLGEKNDAATAEWGEKWRMPTMEEWNELRDKCIWKWMKRGGNWGHEVQGPNGNTIFIPAAGVKFINTKGFADKAGYYWSSTFYSPGSAYFLHFDSENVNVVFNNRGNGQSIRPVTE